MLAEKIIAYIAVTLMLLIGIGTSGLAGYVLYSHLSHPFTGIVLGLVILYPGGNLTLGSVRLWKQLNYDYKESQKTFDIEIR